MCCSLFYFVGALNIRYTYLTRVPRRTGCSICDYPFAAAPIRLSHKNPTTNGRNKILFLPCVYFEILFDASARVELLVRFCSLLYVGAALNVRYTYSTRVPRRSGCFLCDYPQFAAARVRVSHNKFKFSNNMVKTKNYSFYKNQYSFSILSSVIFPSKE